MAQKTNLKSDNFVAKIVTDPKQVPDALLLRGFLGASSEDKHTRLYFNPQLSTYVEIPDDGILHTQDISTDTSPLGGTYVWINKDAILVHGKASAERTRAKFLEGPIVNDYMRAVAQIPPGGGDGGIDNTVAFCPETFAELPCGFTSNNIVCTITQPVTQQQYCPTHQQYCPTQFPCVPLTRFCPPPTGHIRFCPSAIAVCNNTLVCRNNPGGFAQANQQAQAQGNITFAQCVTVVPNCNLTFIEAVCPTRTLACNEPTVVHQACVTIPPVCHFTQAAVVCPTHTLACNHPSVNQICVTQTPVCHYTIAAATCPTHTLACNHPSVNQVCITQTPNCYHTIDICNNPSVLQACNTLGNQFCRVTADPGCEKPTGNCPSVGACPSIACGGFGGGGNPAQ